MSELKIGDRVRIISDPRFIEFTGKKSIIGMTGTVKRLGDTCAGVEFDNYMGGHNGNWGGKDGYCWYVLYERLEKIEDTEEETMEQTKAETMEQKILEMLREEIGVDIGEEFGVYKNGNMQWRCKFEGNEFFRKGIYEFQKSGIWKDIIGNFHKYTFKRKPFVPEYGKDFFLLVEERDENNNIIFVEKRSVWVDSTVDCGMLALGNVFRSRKEALKNKDKLSEKLEKLRKGE